MFTFRLGFAIFSGTFGNHHIPPYPHKDVMSSTLDPSPGFHIQGNAIPTNDLILEIAISII